MPLLELIDREDSNKKIVVEPEGDGCCFLIYNYSEKDNKDPEGEQLASGYAAINKADLKYLIAMLTVIYETES